MKRLFGAAVLLATCLGAFGAAVAADDDRRRYVKTPTGFLMVLRRGDDVFAEVTKLAEREKFGGASLTGIGFLETATFGFYDFEKKAFDPRTFSKVEMASLTGSIAWQSGKPSIHAHAAVSDATFATYGGHALALTVGTGSAEITVTVHSERLEREVDPEIGANVLQLR
ncbi:PPC domain-containing DNA-binding protein [Chenggangzhangella methanolivorans]|uniref:DNA-binding protein n=1 Tax=Chenggangzhangella methanolivorans TaxID=1437009 RepID=A0A9E6R957_9HYPH|nr:PPC domain-containing DNA-binding protein [Chenggangzhangella methanolivorans]QZO00491.1 DNA-binding protein [Chenggangzhangella methanolivorans]